MNDDFRELCQGLDGDWDQRSETCDFSDAKFPQRKGRGTKIGVPLDRIGAVGNDHVISWVSAPEAKTIAGRIISGVAGERADGRDEPVDGYEMRMLEREVWEELEPNTRR